MNDVEKAAVAEDGTGLIDLIRRIKVVPLVTLHSVEEAVPLAKALAAGGVPIAEITFRSPAALEGMRAIHAQVRRRGRLVPGVPDSGAARNRDPERHRKGL